MKFIGDFHIHSKYSMATAKNLDLEHIYISAAQKGIDVVGTGDFTHPAWFAEIEEKLVYDEYGLLKLKDDIEKVCNSFIPKTCKRGVRFILTCELSSIYKKNGVTRKNHNLIFASSLGRAKEINRRLDKIGNIKSDGRPILGLDAKNLLEIILEAGKDNFLVPAHIWTPWFSLFGSKSGFDSIEECFEDMTKYIFALETGLSSDPAMNRLVTSLDGYTLISNSDAHSPAKLGREANLFDTEISYKGIKEAIESGDKKRFLGTFEFFPEEGKYHFDGHRKCGLSLHPDDTALHNGLCPICGESLTLGVLHRVKDLADLQEKRDLDRFPPYYSMIPLVDIIAEIFQMGVSSKRVASNYKKAIEKLGCEFSILNTLTKEEIEGADIPLLGDAIEKMRNNDIILLPGFDGEYGKIKIFDEDERKRLSGQKSLFIIGSDSTNRRRKLPNAGRNSKEVEKKGKKDKKRVFSRKEGKNSRPDSAWQKTIKLNKEQKKAVELSDLNLLIAAGPGTGKTGTITQKIIRLIMEKKVPHEQILAVTFTDKAANEMKARIAESIIMETMPNVFTFHSFCFRFLKDIDKKDYRIINDYEKKRLIADAVKRASVKEKSLPGQKSILDMITAAKRQLSDPDDDLTAFARGITAESLSEIYTAYQRLLSFYKSYDFEDLILNTARILTGQSGIRNEYQKRFKYIFIDEYQDVTKGEYEIIRALVSDKEENSICAIGDPNQSIYGFRGSDVSYFERFTKDFRNSEIISLTRNYRSSANILKAAGRIIESSDPLSKERMPVYSEKKESEKIKIISAASERAEIEAIAERIEKMVGGYGYFSVDTGRARISEKAFMSFADFAVLYRTKSFAKNIAEIFEKRGIPYQIAQREEILSKEGIKEILSFLKIIYGIGIFPDIEQIEKIIRPGVGKDTIERFKEWSYKNVLTPREAMKAAKTFRISGLTNANQMKLYEFFGEIKKHTIEARKLSLTEQIEYIKDMPVIKKTIEEEEKIGEIYNKIVKTASDSNDNINVFFRKIASVKDTDLYDELAEKVTLMTMHAAKGLEFTTVFIAGCEDGWIPFEGFDRVDYDEEKRLLYVAMTRAKDILYLTCSKKRNIYGKLTERSISPFIGLIDEDLKEEEAPFIVKKRKKRYVQREISFGEEF